MQFFISFLLLTILFLNYFFIPYYKFRKMNFPQCGAESFKVWVYHLGVIWTFYLGKIFEKLGICSQICFMRFLIGLVPPVKILDNFITDAEFENVPVRIYQPKKLNTGFKRGVLYLHGGGGIYGCNRIYEPLCNCLARESDSVVVYVEYRLAPEYQHPAQLSDCLAATLYFMKHAEEYGVDPNRILVAGESSGANLTASVCRELAKRGHQPRIQAQILIYPFFQILDLSLPSYFQNRFGPFITRKRVVRLALKFVKEEDADVEAILKNAHVPQDMKLKFKKWISADLIPEAFKARGYEPPPPAAFSKELYRIARLNDDTLLSPILDEDVIIQQLPETYILTCEYDIFRDDGLLYKKRLDDNAVPVTWKHLQEGVHGFITLIDRGIFDFSYTKVAVEDIVSFIKKF